MLSNRWHKLLYTILLLCLFTFTPLSAATINLQYDSSLNLTHPAIHILPYSETYRTYNLPNKTDSIFLNNNLTTTVSNGTYSMALTQVSANTIISLRSKNITVQDNDQTVIFKQTTIPLQIKAKSGDLQIHAIFIRALDDSEILTWNNPDISQTQIPKLIITPGQDYQLIIKGTFNNIPLYYYTKLSRARKNTVEIDSKRLNYLKFKINERSPLHIYAHLDLNLMSETITLNLDASPELYTNRRYLEASYRITLAHLKTVNFGIKSIRAQRKTEVVLGGRWKPHAWVEAMKKKKSGKYVYPIYHKLLVTDESGCILDYNQLEDAGIQYEIVGKNPNVQLPEDYVDDKIWTNQKIMADFKCKVSSTTSVVPTGDIPIERIFTYKTRHFENKVPAPLQMCSRMYMTKAEVAYNHTKPLAEYPGSGKIRVLLITNPSGAKGGWRGKRLGKKNGHISMPAKHFFQKRSYQARVPHLQHEIFHTYGHSHGDDEAMKAFKALERQTIAHWEAYAKTKVLEPEFLPPLIYR
ncbi:hypothetical protein JD969_15145 [Planctomycetota bacterium]|nr:hypothetical protein JD969_15145 [Planctomycetota bacterium]